MAQSRTRSRLEPVGPVVGDLLQGLGLDKRLQEYRAVEVWTEVVGAGIAAHARPTSIQDGVLFVDVDSSVWMQELALLRESIVERLNALLGRACVRRIVLAVEQSPQERAVPGQGEEGESPP